MKKTAKKIVIGNWKMNPSSPKEAEKLFLAIVKSISNLRKTEVAVCVPFVYIEKLKKLSKKISIGGQNVFYEESGAYTGEISAEMIANIGAKYVIIGHSERRAMGEKNSDINKKLKSALSAEIIPVLCVGEIERDENHGYFNLVKTQVEECLDGISKNLLPKIIIAYEPVWSISTTPGRRDAEAHDSKEMSIFIRKIIFDKFAGKIDMPRVIYGGSVNERDSEDFITNGGVDGLLPGKASLDPKKFAEIVRIVENLNKHAVN